MQKVKKILIITLVVIVGLGIIKNPLIKIVVKIGASAVTGAPVKIKSFALGVFRPGVSIKGFKMYNPKGYPKEVMIDIPEITVRYHPLALLKGKIHLKLVTVNMKELVLIKDKEGKLNVDALKISQKKEDPPKAKKDAPKKKKKKKPAKKMAIQIDEANLTLGKVVVKDYTVGEPPLVLAYDIGIKNKTYKNIKSAEQFATLIMIEAMGPAGMKGAAIYGAATVLGVAFLPAGVAGILIGKDSATAEYNASYDEVHKVVKEFLDKTADNIKEDAKAKTIKAKIYGTDVTIKLTEKEAKKTEVTVKARKYMIPKPEVAEGVIYQLSEVLK